MKSIIGEIILDKIIPNLTNQFNGKRTLELIIPNIKNIIDKINK